MDLNEIRSAVTVISLVVFVGIIAWSFNRKRGRDFDAAAAVPFADDGSGVDDVAAPPRKGHA